MKKKILVLSTITIIAIITTIEINPNVQVSHFNFSTENIEAIASPEDGLYNLCYYESKVTPGRTYYNCGECRKKVYDEKGLGTISKCFY